MLPLQRCFLKRSYELKDLHFIAYCVITVQSLSLLLDNKILPVQLKVVHKETNRTTINPPLSHYRGYCTIVQNMGHFYLLVLYWCFTNSKCVFACHQLAWWCALQPLLCLPANFIYYLSFSQPSARYHCMYVRDESKSAIFNT